MKRTIQILSNKFLFFLLFWSLSIVLLFSSYNLEIFLLEQEEITIKNDNFIFSIYDNKKKNQIQNSTLQIKTNNNHLFVNNQQFENKLIISANQLIINDIEYKGTLIITAQSNNQIRVINQIDLEDYIAGVIPAEIGGGASIEALKAQAITTRTYTIKSILNGKHQKDGYDLCNTTHCQVYAGFKGQTELSNRAVKETINTIITYKNEPIEAFYSASCGGITENSGNVWLKKFDYLIPQADDYCIDLSLIPSYAQKNINWEKSFSMQELEKMFEIQKIDEIIIQNTNNSPRVYMITIKSGSDYLEIKGNNNIRQKLSLLSNLFLIKKEDFQIRIIGNGFGHGVGLCQIGAIARAKNGQSYQQILQFYFPQTKIDHQWVKKHKKL